MIALTLENFDALKRRFDPADVLKALDRSVKTAAARVSTTIRPRCSSAGRRSMSAGSRTPESR